MLVWFKKVAPIRSKFRVLSLAQLVLGLVTAILTVMSVEDIMTSHLATLVVLGCAIAGPIIISYAGKLISDPYVATVERIEALVAGDLTSPVAYTDYEDCVGRLTKALAVFRDQALELQRSSITQAEVVRATSASLRRLAANELDARMHEGLPAEYADIRDNFNSAAIALDRTMSSVAGAAADILGGSREVQTASNDLAARTEEQAASLAHSASSLSSVSSAIASNAEAAVAASHAVRDVQNQASGGNDVVSQAIDAMAKIQGSSEEISQIVAVIDGIAFQTNLLALNAGVEAARAGESGKGFAVVATEVRALAQRSGEAATQIRRIIQASTAQVQEGVGLVDATGRALTAIAARIDSTVDSINVIASSSTTQSEALASVMDAIHQMDVMTQQNAAMVEENSAASRQLAEQSANLSRLISEFRISPSNVVSLGDHSAQARRAALRSVKAGAGKAALAIADDWSSF